jgi:hypothetical protein
MISPVTVVTVGVFGLLVVLIVTAFIILVGWQKSERSRRYHSDKSERSNREYPSEHAPFNESAPGAEARRRESIIVIGIIVLFIVFYLLASFFL